MDPPAKNLARPDVRVIDQEKDRQGRRDARKWSTSRMAHVHALADAHELSLTGKPGLCAWSMTALLPKCSKALGHSNVLSGGTAHHL